ncbi:hypothetical protein CLE01_30010 [Cryobacterium levicorallinum]|uniref:Uncharacterized protein n=1 Tax=Cryobacterium levicorallinum TaxID=995038 RepID=A0ABY1EHP6_9MICO|nr:hypothetical protein CLE01_30010 [Cryobacterium levicorallinum]SFH89245.1 hypothetical protein SAMN05216274_12023 [Cryobacterium levicorallinum]
MLVLVLAACHARATFGRACRLRTHNGVQEQPQGYGVGVGAGARAAAIIAVMTA